VRKTKDRPWWRLSARVPLACLSSSLTVLAFLFLYPLRAEPFQREVQAQAAPSKSNGPRSSTQVRIVKIFEVLNDPKQYKTGGNPALEFERKYWNYGAVTQEQQMEKQGHVFLFIWKTRGPRADLLARFEYRQVGSRDQVSVQELRYPGAHGTVRSTFFVTGRAYQSYGPVSSWRFSILDGGGRILSQKRSYIW
jgi:hypothetical protein